MPAGWNCQAVTWRRTEGGTSLSFSTTALTWIERKPINMRERNRGGRSGRGNVCSAQSWEGSPLLGWISKLPTVMRQVGQVHGRGIVTAGLVWLVHRWSDVFWAGKRAGGNSWLGGLSVDVSQRGRVPPQCHPFRLVAALGYHLYTEFFKKAFVCHFSWPPELTYLFISHFFFF